ncbi:MAG: hypothetical protein RI890_890, partial [Actinomycetota bacterium]
MAALELDGAVTLNNLHKAYGDRVVGGGSYRWYDQTGAFFYAPSYTGSPQYFTGDFRLFPFNSDLYNGHLEITPKNGIFRMPPGTVLRLQYERYLAERWSAVAGL